MEDFKNAFDSTSNIETIFRKDALGNSKNNPNSNEKGEDEWSPRKNKPDPHEALRSASGKDFEGE